MAKVEDFDVPALTQQLKAMGASYFVLTLGQNSGFFNSPNSVYDRIVGCASGERCARRDLPLDLYRALPPEGIRLMLYLPCQTPNADRRAQRAFGLPEGRQDQPIDEEFAHKWAEVIHEWSGRYGDKVAGWWFDGGYQHIQFNEAIARIYADAVKRGNPKAIVTFNLGVRLVRHTRAEDYTAGELNEPFDVLPTSRWVAKGTPVVVALHLCFDAITNRDELVDALGDANVVLVLGGHYHKAKVDRFRDVNFVQLPSPAPNGSHEVTVIWITSDRLLAIPYQYESKTWSDVRGKILHVPIRGPASTAGVRG